MPIVYLYNCIFVYLVYSYFLLYPSNKRLDEWLPAISYRRAGSHISILVQLINEYIPWQLFQDHRFRCISHRRD